MMDLREGLQRAECEGSLLNSVFIEPPTKGICSLSAIVQKS